MHRHLLALALIWLASTPAQAQPEIAEADIAPASSDHWRVDLFVPVLSLGGVFHTSGLHQDGPNLTAALELRAMHGSGHGFAVRGGIALGRVTLYPSIEVDYLHTTQLAGDRRLGLVLQLLGGLSFADAEDCVGFWGCVDQPGVDGFHAGANVGASLVFQAYGFTVGLDARYTVLSPTDRATEGERWEPLHALTAGAVIGFGFY